MEVLGIDIGGSGIKGTIVDTKTGEFLKERHRIPTPQPATIDDIAETVKAIVDHFKFEGPVGCGFPSVIQNGVVKTASNIHKSWINVNVDEVFGHITGLPVHVFNDADAAGAAELQFGCVKGYKGLAIFLTIGTGIGSAIINHGQLIPNSELGHVYLDNGMKVEHFASDAVRKKEDLNRKEWGERFNIVLKYFDKLFYPDLFVLGGGSSKKFHKYAETITVKTPVKPAELLNQAGIIGAALLASRAL
ncbi:Polyphosphate glucokinase [Salinivirga cyanobacteriivorans]|uniref:Polyphosphate glucokinase n=1 Tax=Salinivirga cyanobacteriivorans TaxID=1307839 RepID=A0A0S2HW46_9BACT|nr:ROK family protein [Salinivirga cyanobacteriivorans]ALO14256.1 Polyphosphate glucokinase [Salinivirga cyanobacteriivorans]